VPTIRRHAVHDEQGRMVKPFALAMDAETWIEARGKTGLWYVLTEELETEDEAKKPPKVYRMARCRHCPRYCKPCLTVDEAQVILADDTRRQYRADDICSACHQKSNDKQNVRTYANAGRSWNEEHLTEEERLRKEIDRISKLLAKMGVE